MTAPLSVLDLAVVRADSTHAEALADTIAVAREADRLGYRRFWVAEHHGMPGIASSSPPVLIGAIAAATERIRVGSGGVMLPNHSSLIVAEQFGTLIALHGDRIDLGLGRAPGTDQVVTAAIRRGIAETVDDFPAQVLELLAYFGTIPALEGGHGSRIVAIPGMGDAPQLWLLGSSDFSARLAGMMGLPFAFAHHFAGGDQTPLAFEAYRRSFRPSVVMTEPHAMVAVTALVADSAEEARDLMDPAALQFIRLRSGRPTRLPSIEEAAAHPWTEGERTFAADRIRHQAIGTLPEVRASIDGLVAATGADEVLVVPQGPTVSHRLHTVRELAADAA